MVKGWEIGSIPQVDSQLVEKLYSKGFLSDEETLARQGRGRCYITRVCEQDELVLCWRREKHEASLANRRQAFCQAVQGLTPLMCRKQLVLSSTEMRCC